MDGCTSVYKCVQGVDIIETFCRSKIRCSFRSTTTGPNLGCCAKFGCALLLHSEASVCGCGHQCGHQTQPKRPFVFLKTAVSMDSCDGCDILGALLFVAHDDGDLDDDDLLVLAAMVEFASARGLLRIDLSLHLGNRLHLSSLDDEICLSRFRFTRKQFEELMIGMQIPDEFRSPCRTKWFGLDGLLIVLR